MQTHNKATKQLSNFCWLTSVAVAHGCLVSILRVTKDLQIFVEASVMDSLNSMKTVNFYVIRFNSGIYRIYHCIAIHWLFLLLFHW